MTPQSRTFVLAGLIAIFCGANSALAKANRSENLEAKVIYGEDNRLDLYQVEDAAMKTLADSTVALIRPNAITIEGEIARITESIIGRTYNLCHDEPFYDQNSAAFCSGFLVAPDTIVTAGHCIRNEASCANTRFVFGFALNSEGERATQVPASEVYSCVKVVHSVAQSNGEDFAVVKIDRAVANHTPLTMSAGNPEPKTPLTVIGHPSGLPTKVSGGAEVRRVNAQFLVANLDTYGGNSGSAVFNSDTGAVEGILVRGEQDYVFENGCRRSKVCSSDGCRGEDVTLIKQTFPYLQ